MKIDFVSGIFFAHDPLGVAQYDISEYKMYAEVFCADFQDKETTITAIKSWFKTKYSQHGFIEAHSFEALCKSLSRLN